MNQGRAGCGNGESEPPQRRLESGPLPLPLPGMNEGRVAAPQKTWFPKRLSAGFERSHHRNGMVIDERGEEGANWYTNISHRKEWGQRRETHGKRLSELSTGSGLRTAVFSAAGILPSQYMSAANEKDT